MSWNTRDKWIITWNLYLFTRVIKLYACKFWWIYKTMEDLKTSIINDDLKSQFIGHERPRGAEWWGGGVSDIWNTAWFFFKSVIQIRLQNSRNLKFSSGLEGTIHKWGFEVTMMDNENLNISLQLFSFSYELGIAVEHLTTTPCCSSISVICLSYEFFVNFSAGVRIWSWCANFRKYCWCANSYTSVV